MLKFNPVSQQANLMSSRIVVTTWGSALVLPTLTTESTAFVLLDCFFLDPHRLLGITELNQYGTKDNA